MPQRFRLTRRMPIALSEDAWRRLRSFAAEARLSEDEALSFLFENFDAVTDAEELPFRLRRWSAALEARRR